MLKKVFLLIALNLVWAIFFPLKAASTNSDTTTSTHDVFLFTIDDEIGPASERLLKLALESAEKRGSDLVLIELNTYGGALNSADDMRQRLLNCPIPVWVFVNKNAASAGALISIACDSIFMAPGATIGAATVVSGGDGTPVPEKYQSYMRSMMRATAEANHRDPDIAEAMVGNKKAVDSLKSEGEVLTLTTDEAIERNYCEGKFTSTDDILAHYKLSGKPKYYFKPDSIEKIIAFFLNPVISGLLIMVIIGGVYFELQTPGVGFPLAAAIVAGVLYLIPHYLHGLATYWEAIVFVIGIGLLLVEILVIPGFGIAGVSGIGLMLLSLTLMMIKNRFFEFEGVDDNQLTMAFATAFGGLMGSAIIIVVGSYFFIKSNIFARVALNTTLGQGNGSLSGISSLMGQQGVAITDLRPSGKVQIDGRMYDAMARQGYIEQGENVVVVSVSMSQVMVKSI